MQRIRWRHNSLWRAYIAGVGHIARIRVFSTEKTMHGGEGEQFQSAFQPRKRALSPTLCIGLVIRWRIQCVHEVNRQVYTPLLGNPPSVC